MERREHEVERLGVRRRQRSENSTPQAMETRCPHVQQVSNGNAETNKKKKNGIKRATGRSEGQETQCHWLSSFEDRSYDSIQNGWSQYSDGERTTAKYLVKYSSYSLLPVASEPRKSLVDWNFSFCRR